MRESWFNCGWPVGAAICLEVQVPPDASMMDEVQSPLNDRQAGGGDGLTDAAGFFVRHMQLDFFRDFGKFCFQNFARLGEHNVAALAGRDAAKNQQMAKIIKVRVMWNRTAQINADGLINFCRARIAFGHEALNLIE